MRDHNTSSRLWNGGRIQMRRDKIRYFYQFQSITVDDFIKANVHTFPLKYRHNSKL